MSALRRIVLALVVFGGPPALADWDLGDYHKMHYPQLPELYYGIDVDATLPKVLADDWQCSESGYVTDIHFWGSWDYDYKYPGAWIHASIHEYLPPDDIYPWSRPGETLWQHDFPPAAPGAYGYTQREWIEPDAPPPYPQFFWDPKEPFQPIINHYTIWQYNIEDIPNAFYQYLGELYFLDISFFAGYDPAGNPIPLPPGYRFGWKNSRSPQFNDDAVWGHYGPPPYGDWGPQPGEDKPHWPPPPYWYPLVDPRSGQSMDLAFVITPEPVTATLLGLGGLLLLRRRRP